MFRSFVTDSSTSMTISVVNHTHFFSFTLVTHCDIGYSDETQTTAVLNKQLIHMFKYWLIASLVTNVTKSTKTLN